jgi:hypothetical protein
LDFHDATGGLSAIPIAWTDRAAPDPFVVVAAGRCHLRFEDLLRLVGMVKQECKAKRRRECHDNSAAHIDA